MRCTLSKSETSTEWRVTLAPDTAASISFFACSSLPMERACKDTLAPPAQNLMAVARPSPLLPPVMSTCLPFTSNPGATHRFHKAHKAIAAAETAKYWSPQNKPSILSWTAAYGDEEGREDEWGSGPVHRRRLPGLICLSVVWGVGEVTAYFNTRLVLLVAGTTRPPYFTRTALIRGW